MSSYAGLLSPSLRFKYIILSICLSFLPFFISFFRYFFLYFSLFIYFLCFYWSTLTFNSGLGMFLFLFTIHVISSLRFYVRFFSMYIQARAIRVPESNHRLFWFEAVQIWTGIIWRIRFYSQNCIVNYNFVQILIWNRPFLIKICPLLIRLFLIKSQLKSIFFNYS